MADFPTREDLFRVARDRILGLNAKLSADVVQRDGTDANVLLAGGAAMADEVVGQLINVCRGQFLDSSEEARLERLALDRYTIVKKPAAPSLGTVKFTTTALTTSAFSIPAGTQLTTSDGVQFITTVTTSFPVSSVGPTYVSIRSILAGFNQQAKAGAITSIVSSIAGSPSDLAVTNVVATAGAADAESDDSLRDRCRRFWTTAQRGTLAAIEAGALAVPGVVKANAIEVLDSTGRPGRWVQLLISDRFTDALVTINQTSALYDAQAQSLARTVFLALSNVRCAGMFVQVIVAQVVLIQSRLDLTFAAGVDPILTSEQARAAVVNYTNELVPGESFEPEAAAATLRAVNGLIITGNEIAVPAGTIVPRAMQVLRTTIDLVTATNQGASLFTTVNPDQIITEAT